MTAFNIDNFISNLYKTGTLQTNKFNVYIRPPGVLGGTIGNRSQHLIYRAESARIPGLTFSTIDSRRYGVGPRSKTVSNVEYQEMTIVFIEDAQSTVHKYFYNWMNEIFSNGGQGAVNANTYGARYKNDYATTIVVQTFDNTGKFINTVSVLEAFPISMGDVSLSWSDNNSLIKISVTFAYTKWINNASNTLPTVIPGLPTAPPSPTASASITPRPRPRPTEAENISNSVLNNGIY